MYAMKWIWCKNGIYEGSRMSVSGFERDEVGENMWR